LDILSFHFIPRTTLEGSSKNVDFSAGLSNKNSKIEKYYTKVLEILISNPRAIPPVYLYRTEIP
jgi:hypothetical protein